VEWNATVFRGIPVVRRACSPVGRKVVSDSLDSGSRNRLTYFLEREGCTCGDGGWKGRGKGLCVGMGSRLQSSWCFTWGPYIWGCRRTESPMGRLWAEEVITEDVLLDWGGGSVPNQKPTGGMSRGSGLWSVSGRRRTRTQENEWGVVLRVRGRVFWAEGGGRDGRGG